MKVVMVLAVVMALVGCGGNLGKWAESDFGQTTVEVGIDLFQTCFVGAVVPCLPQSLKKQCINEHGLKCVDSVRSGALELFGSLLGLGFAQGEGVAQGARSGAAMRAASTECIDRVDEASATARCAIGGRAAEYCIAEDLAWCVRETASPPLRLSIQLAPVAPAGAGEP